MKSLDDRPLRVAGEPLALHLWRMLRWIAEVRLVPHWQERFRDPLTSSLRMLLVDGLTRSGKVLLGVCGLLLLLGFRRGESFYLSSAGAGIGLLAWCKFLGWLYRPQVRLSRTAPEHAVAGQEYRSTIWVENSGPRPLKNFAVREMRMPGAVWPREWTLAYGSELAPGDAARVSVAAVPKRRGVLKLWGITVQSYFPFFLSRSCRKQALPREVHVLPEPFANSLPSLRQLGELAASASKFGSNRGGKEQALHYTHSRPFQTGDPPTRIDHRASARRGEPMTKLYRGTDLLKPEAVAIVCDTSVGGFLDWQRRAQNPQVLDRRMALVSEVGLRAQGEGLPVAAVCWDGQWKTIANLHEFHREVATATESRRRSLPESLPDSQWIYILVLGNWGPDCEARIGKWRADGQVVVVFLLPERPEDVGCLPTEAGFYEVGE